MSDTIMDVQENPLAPYLGDRDGTEGSTGDPELDAIAEQFATDIADVFRQALERAAKEQPSQ